MNTNAGESTQQPEKQLSFGEKAAGVTLNPSNDPRVDSIKAKAAALIDEANDLRRGMSGEAARYLSKAISHMEDASMNAVKGITWRY